MNKPILVLLLLSSSVVFAKGKAMKINYSSYGTSSLSTVVPENRLMLDAAPLLMNGLGVSYERTVLPQLTVGPYVSFFKLSSDKEKTNSIEFKNDVRLYGVRARYFISEEADSNGIYLMAGIGAVEIKSNVAYSNIAASAGSTGFGGIGGAGYQLIAKNTNMGLWAINLGATYANGYTIQNQAKINPSTSSADVDAPKALGDIFFETNIALLF